MADCKFKRTSTRVGCEGGHTTAQHHMNVYERVIKEACGLEAHHAIEKAVNDEARAHVVMLAFVGYIAVKDKCTRDEALLKAAQLCSLTDMFLEAKKNG